MVKQKTNNSGLSRSFGPKLKYKTIFVSQLLKFKSKKCSFLIYSMRHERVVGILLLWGSQRNSKMRGHSCFSGKKFLLQLVLSKFCIKQIQVVSWWQHFFKLDEMVTTIYTFGSVNEARVVNENDVQPLNYQVSDYLCWCQV